MILKSWQRFEILKIMVLSREDLIYTILRSEKSSNEDESRELIKSTYTNNIHEKINIARIRGEKKDDIRKQIKDIEDRIAPRRRRIRRRNYASLVNKINAIIKKLEKKNKYKYGDPELNALSDIEFFYGNANAYYKPILTKQCFETNYLRYTSRRDKDRESQYDEYMEIVTPYIYELLDEMKDNIKKLQLDIKINTKNLLNPNEKRTFTVKSMNIEVTPSDDISDVIIRLTESLHDNFQQEMLVLRNGSNFVFDSIIELNINMHQVDLRRGSSYIESPKWLKQRCSN